MFSRAGVTGVPGILQTGSSKPISYAMHANNTLTHQHWPSLENQQKFTLKNVQEVRALFILQIGSMLVYPSCTLEKGQLFLHKITFQVHITGAECSCQRSGFGEQVCPGEPQQCGSSINSLVPTINDYDTWWWCTLWRIINDIVNEECLHCPKIFL